MPPFGFGFSMPAIRGGGPSYGSEVTTYINNVTAQGGTLLPGVASGLNDLVTNLKADGVWSGITDLHIACGVSNIAGACVKLVSSNVSYLITQTNYAVTAYESPYIASGIDAGLNNYSNLKYITAQIAPPSPRTLVIPQINLPSVASWGFFGGCPNASFLAASGGGFLLYNEVATTFKAQAYSTFGGADYVQTNATLGGGDFIVARESGTLKLQVGNSTVATASGAQSAALGLRVINLSPTVSAWFATQGLTLAQTQTVRNRVRTFLQSAAIGRTYSVNTFNYYGDSLSAGDNYGGQIAWPNQLADATTYPIWVGRKANFAYANTLAQTLSNTTITNSSIKSQAPSLYQTKVIGLVFYGTNDLNNSATAATVLGYLRTGWALIRSMGCKVVAFTITPRADASWTAPKEAERVSLNASILADSANWDAVIDAAAIPALSNPNDATYYLADKLHFTTAGHTALANYVYANINPNTL